VRGVLGAPGPFEDGIAPQDADATGTDAGSARAMRTQRLRLRGAEGRDAVRTVPGGGGGGHKLHFYLQGLGTDYAAPGPKVSRRRRCKSVLNRCDTEALGYRESNERSETSVS